jgi:hypothetical protein
MTLTLRLTRLSRDPHAKDWRVSEDGVGRLYEDVTASRLEIACFWSIHCDGAGPPQGRRGDARGGQGTVCGSLGGFPTGGRGLGFPDMSVALTVLRVRPEQQSRQGLSRPSALCTIL